MILVYSAAESARLHYVLKLLGREIFNATPQHTTDSAVFLAFEGPKLQYGGDRLPGPSFYIPAVSLLFEKDIRAQSPVCFLSGSLPAFFDGEGDLPFDLFAGIFFLLSRYEEWLPYPPDEYGRFPPQASLAFQNGFLHRPLVDEWLQLFEKRLAVLFPSLSFRKRRFAFLPTYDIDMARSFARKGLLRNTGGIFRDLLKGNLPALKNRFAVLCGARPDPFDSFSWLESLHRNYHYQPTYFFLLAAAPGRFDKNLSPEDPLMRRLIKELSGRYASGIHPSFQSGDRPALLSQEMATLARLSGKAVTASRQHYLRLSMPVTFRRLLESGIRNDFSMGYGPLNGFRASFAGDFFWYDLEAERETELLLTPFCFMDAAAYNIKGNNPAAVMEEMRSLRRSIADVNGRMTTLWHNHFLGTAPEFAGWRDAYEAFVRETVSMTGR